MSDDERKRLYDRLALLDEERGHITYTLEMLERLDPASSSRTDTRLVRIINASARTWRAPELVDVLRQDGWGHDVNDEVQTVRTALARAARHGLIERLERGLYQAASPRPTVRDRQSRSKML